MRKVREFLKRQSFLKGSAVLLIMVLVTKIIGLAYKIPLTSMLGGSGMSCYSGAFAVFTPVFAFAAGGIPSTMSRLVSQQLASCRYYNALKIKKAAMLIFGLMSLALSVGLILLSGTLAENAVHIPKAQYALIAVALSLFPAAMMNVQRGWAEGMESMTPTAVSEIAETVFKLIFGLLGAYLVLDYANKSFESYHGCFGIYCSDSRAAVLTAVPYAAAASALGVSLASFFACIFLFIINRRRSHSIAAELKAYSLPLNLRFITASKQIAKYALPASVTAVAATLSSMADLLTITPGLNKAFSANPQLFVFLSSYGYSSEDRASFVYGSYTGLALTIFGLAPTFTAMLGKSILPSLTCAYTENDRSEIKKSVSSLLLLSSAISIPCGLGIFVFSKELLNLFFSGSTAEIIVSQKPLSILGIAVIFMGIAMPCMSALSACNKQVSALFITISATLLKLALNMLLIPLDSVNISGAALSTVISQAVMCMAAVASLVKGTGCGWKALKSIFVTFLPSFLCVCTAILTQQLLVSRLDGVFLRFGVVISVLNSAIICLFSYLLLCISPKNQILSIFSKKISKNT